MKSKIFTQLPARDEASSGVHHWRRSSRAERQAERYEQGIDQRRLVAQTNGDYTDTDQEELGQPGGGKLGQQKGDQNRQKQRYSLQGAADNIKTRRFLNLMLVVVVIDARGAGVVAGVDNSRWRLCNGGRNGAGISSVGLNGCFRCCCWWAVGARSRVRCRIRTAAGRVVNGPRVDGGLPRWGIAAVAGLGRRVGGALEAVGAVGGGEVRSVGWLGGEEQ